MLHFRTPHACWTPPDAVRDFQGQVAQGLGGVWTVDIVAYDDDVPEDTAFISASLVAATQGGLRVQISRHGGTDQVLVALGESAPVPFEDLAVATGEFCIDELVRRAAADVDEELCPVVPFPRTLELLHDWGCELPDALSPNNEHTATSLRQIADQVVAAAGLLPPG